MRAEHIISVEGLDQLERIKDGDMAMECLSLAVRLHEGRTWTADGVLATADEFHFWLMGMGRR